MANPLLIPTHADAAVRRRCRSQDSKARSAGSAHCDAHARQRAMHTDLRRPRHDALSNRRIRRDLNASPPAAHRLKGTSPCSARRKSVPRCSQLPGMITTRGSSPAPHRRMNGRRPGRAGHSAQPLACCLVFGVICGTGNSTINRQGILASLHCNSTALGNNLTIPLPAAHPRTTRCGARGGRARPPRRPCARPTPPGTPT